MPSSTIAPGNPGQRVASGPGASFDVDVPAAGSEVTVDLGTYRLGRIGFPADIGTATAMTFATSHDGQTYRDLYDAFGVEYSVKALAGKAVVPDLTMFAAARFVKIRFGTGATANVYANARTVTLSCLA